MHARSFFVTILAALLSLPMLAGANVAYSDDFDSGSSPFTASPYYLDPSQQDGLIIQTTVGDTSFHNQITNDVSGSGYFLFDGTLNESTPSGQTAFYISPSFTVAPDTDYVLSFYFANSNTGDLGSPTVAQIQPEMNGAAIGSTFSAPGIWSTNGWQQFSFSFNSGSNTSEVLTLEDYQTNGPNGNDFGIDNILVQTPEPSSIATAMIGGISLCNTSPVCKKFCAKAWREGFSSDT